MPRTPPLEVALQVLLRVEDSGAFSNRLLAHHLKGNKLSQREGALLQELVKGVLQNRSKLDGLLRPLTARAIPSLPAAIRNLLRLGAYQMIFLTQTPPPVAVSNCVELAKKYGHRGTAGLVNAVLRKIASLPKPGHEGEMVARSPEYLAQEYSHPLWLVERWAARLGLEEAEALCIANNARHATGIRVNTLKTSRESLERMLSRDGALIAAAKYDPDCMSIVKLPSGKRLTELQAFRAGLFQVQDESSVLAGRIAAPKPGEFVIDLCSAPGGKTSHMAALMKNKGRILAVDSHPGRLKLVGETCRRLGITIVETVCADACTLRLPTAADRILVDAPCSGTGALGRKADARWNKTAARLKELSALQTAILENASRLLAVTGRLVYSTCSLEPEENEEVTLNFLGNHPDYSIIPLPACIPEPLRDDSEFFRAWPQRSGLSGAFAACLGRP